MDEENPEIPMELADHNYDQSNDNRDRNNDGSNDGGAVLRNIDLIDADNYLSGSDDTVEFENSDESSEGTSYLISPTRPFRYLRRFTEFPFWRFATFGSRDADSTYETDETSELQSENELFENYLQEANEEAERFDTDLPAEHLYLGSMERVSGVKYFQPGCVYHMQVFKHHTVIYPGETYPMFMKSFSYQTLNRTDDGIFFGLIFPYDLIGRKNQVSGVTCQIYERGAETDGIISIKSRVCQRFEVCTHKDDLSIYGRSGRRYADVRILPDVVLPDPLLSYTSSSINRLRSNNSSRLLHNKIRLYQSNSSIWPKFLFDQYDVSIVLEKIENYLKTLKLNVSAMPSDMSLLSFWLARHIPLEQKDRELIFLMNCATQRILHIGKSLNYNCGFCCQRCDQKLALYSSIFAMSKQGIKTSYCNPSGYVHETVTVYNMAPNSIFMTDSPSTEFSWFPGYAWQIALCKRCRNHIGWRFTSTNPNMVPRIFYALAGKSIQVKTLHFNQNCEIRNEEVLTSQDSVE